MNSCAKRIINDLSNEVLLLIFQEVVSLVTQHPEFDEAQDLADASAFPGSITRVCKKWKNLIKNIPHFSTRVMAFVDEPLSTTELERQFSLSRSLLIKVFVVRRDYTTTEDSSEKGRVRDVMKALVPHVTRCQVVVFDILHDSSLPPITYFSGKADRLRTLRMKARIHGSVILDRTQPTPTPSLRLNPKVFLCPRLQYLNLDGRIFVQAMSIPGWAESIHMLSQKRLTVSNLSPSPDFHLDDLLTAVERLGHLTELKLSYVDLDAPSNVGKPFISIFVQNFQLEGLKRDFLSGFFTHHYNTIDVTRIVMEGCELGRVDFYSCWYLHIRGLGEGENINEFVRYWDGFGLYIKDCPGLDDTLIELLANPQRSGSFVAPTMRQLEISSSGVVSVNAIKSLVLNRVPGLAPVHLQQDSLKPMYSISVFNTDVSIVKEDKDWFESKLEFFNWTNPPPKSCQSPLLEDDLANWDFSQVNERVLEDIGWVEKDACLISPPTPQDEQSSPVLPADYSLLEWSAEDLSMIDRQLGILAS
ncbi:hypothetical protein CVT26_011926 [Gymnopilus dilepis]|uniref:F-box domain-containing protein n=1 Tax=Gymnopilus dilepis TaxID=231916 RepID=A0A409W952_9AGAR|nr:hypothetical protein CVT26_011926 [Gymnopilus dilepis]